jgi:hypothetical protein
MSQTHRLAAKARARNTLGRAVLGRLSRAARRDPAADVLTDQAEDVREAFEERAGILDGAAPN